MYKFNEERERETAGRQMERKMDHGSVSLLVPLVRGPRAAITTSPKNIALILYLFIFVFRFPLKPIFKCVRQKQHKEMYV